MYEYKLYSSAAILLVKMGQVFFNQNTWLQPVIYEGYAAIVQPHRMMAEVVRAHVHLLKQSSPLAWTAANTLLFAQLALIVLRTSNCVHLHS